MNNQAGSPGLPRVSVVIPMRNEEEYIGRCIESVISQDYPKELIEVIVVDGGSDDGSLQIVRKLAEEYSNITLLGGRGINCPAAMNIGIKNGRGELISKIDAHGYVASDFLSMGVRHLSKGDSIKCVGGPIRPAPESFIAKANALARSSIFGVGRGIYSMGEKPQFAETVQCGTYKKDIFEEIGLFDESLQFGEDEEINWRIIRNGYKIFVTPEIRFFYFPRNSFRKLYRQYFNYGMLRVRVIRKHPSFFNIKHMIPAVFVLSLFTSVVIAMFVNAFSIALLGIVLMYIIVSLTASAVIGAKEGWKYVLLLPISFAALHFGYGIGFFRGIVGWFWGDWIRKGMGK